MRLKIDTIIFDLDGTLIDPRKDFLNSLNQAMIKFGLEPFSDLQDISRFLGPGITYLIDTILPPERISEAQDFVNCYRAIYNEHCLDETRLYGGVRETLPLLNGIKLAVTTNKPGPVARKILAGLGIIHYFSVVVGGEEVGNLKPNPEPIELTLKRLGAGRPTTMIVGDSYCDILAGKAAGIITCGAAYGFNDRSALEPLNPDFIIADFRQLLDIINKTPD